MTHSRNNWASPQRAAEIYARTISNCADNVMATNRIANNTLFANIGAYKTFVQREKDDVKEFSRIAANIARTFENNSREFCQIIRQYKVALRARIHFFNFLYCYPIDTTSTVYSFWLFRHGMLQTGRLRINFVFSNSI